MIHNLIKYHLHSLSLLGTFPKTIFSRNNSVSGRRSLHNSSGSMDAEKLVQVDLPDNQVRSRSRSKSRSRSSIQFNKELITTVLNPNFYLWREFIVYKFHWYRLENWVWGICSFSQKLQFWRSQWSRLGSIV